ncbi:hypothetical protein PENSPDRAFT_652269 [Peniophora sp. CONT]|nr:hypothetical protein PENSPDRAFT_652269 [Peniophora sp. CONT]
MSAHSDTKHKPGTGSSDRPSSAFSNSILAEKLGPLMPPQAHIPAAPIHYTPVIPAQRPPAHRTRTSTSSRPSIDVHRSPHLTPAPPRRSNSSRRNILSQSASLRRAAGTPSNMSVADSASVYSTASVAHEQDAIAALPTVAERWRWRPRSQTPVLVLRNFREEDGEGEKAV